MYCVGRETGLEQLRRDFLRKRLFCYLCSSEDSVLALSGDWGAPRWVDFNGSRNWSSHVQLGTEEPVWGTPGRNPSWNRVNASKHCCLWTCIFPDAWGTVSVILTGHSTRNGKSLVENVIGVHDSCEDLGSQSLFPPLVLPLIPLWDILLVSCYTFASPLKNRQNSSCKLWTSPRESLPVGTGGVHQRQSSKKGETGRPAKVGFWWLE